MLACMAIYNYNMYVLIIYTRMLIDACTSILNPGPQTTPLLRLMSNVIVAAGPPPTSLKAQSWHWYVVALET